MDTSIVLPLQELGPGVDDDAAFTRLDDVKYGSSPILINVHYGSEKPFPLEVAASNTVAALKRLIVQENILIENVQIEFSGEILDNERTLAECGVVSGSELSVSLQEKDGVHTRPLESRSRGVSIEPEAVNRGLLNKARARALYEWNGGMEDGQTLGLPFTAQEPVMVGRVINKDWYEGYLPDDRDQCGYIPRNYVEIEAVYDERFLQSLGSDGVGLKVSPMPPLSPPPLLLPRWLSPLSRLLKQITSFFSRKHKGHPKSLEKSFSSMSQGARPPLPPSPFPPKPPVPTFDLLKQGNRVRATFQLEHDDQSDHAIVHTIISLIAGPQYRVSSATVELAFEHDTILDLDPKRFLGPETEVHHSNNVVKTLSGTGGAGYGPAQLALTAQQSKTKVAEFSRRTRGTIFGDGTGSSKAYWVLKEDYGEAGRLGLDSEQRMSVTLHVRPGYLDYQVIVKITADDGGSGGWFNDKRLTSGRQRYYFGP